MEGDAVRCIEQTVAIGYCRKDKRRDDKSQVYLREKQMVSDSRMISKMKALQVRILGRSVSRLLPYSEYI
jgi:hypothetical protein